MPTFRDAEHFAREVGELDRRITSEARKATERSANQARTIAIRHASRNLGGDTRYSGWPNRDLADLNVRPLRSRTGHILAPTRKSGGPWKVAEQGRHIGTTFNRGGQAQFFGPGINRKTGLTNYTKTGKIRKSRGGGVKRWNGYVAAKRVASQASAEMERKLDDLVAEAGTAAMKRHFDVT